MAALIGDAIIAGRQTIPDMPQVLPASTASVSVVSSAGSTLPAGTYACVVTQRNQWGETLYSGETTGLVVGTNQGIQVTSPLQPGATTIRAYLTLPGGAAGSEQQFVESSVSPFIISAPLPSSGVPPTLNRAFLPDTDGNLVSASAIYQWLCDGLKMISRETGGLLDYSGVQSTINQPLYTVSGEWNEITSVWYDGYWMSGGDRGTFFRRNNISSQILSSATISVINNLNVLEVYPQPARTAASTTLSASMSSSATSASLTTAGGFVLPFGFMQVDSEIMAYAAIFGNNMTGLIRGLGGSPAVAHNSGAPVLELNIFWSGKRQLSPAYVPGNSQSALPVPTGWEVLLAQYIGGRAKIIEHDAPMWDAFNKSMKDSIKSWAGTNRGVMRRRQVGGSNQPAVLYPDISGGILLPSLVLPILYIGELKHTWHNGAGGVPWTLFIFMLFLILALRKSGTLGKRLTQLLEGISTTAFRRLNFTGKPKRDGSPNYEKSDSNPNSQSLRNVIRATGRTEKDSGFLVMEESGNYSTPGMEEKLFLREARRAIGFSLRNFAGFLVQGLERNFEKHGQRSVRTTK